MYLSIKGILQNSWRSENKAAIRHCSNVQNLTITTLPNKIIILKA